MDLIQKVPEYLSDGTILTLLTSSQDDTPSGQETEVRLRQQHFLDVVSMGELLSNLRKRVAKNTTKRNSIPLDVFAAILIASVGYSANETVLRGTTNEEVSRLWKFLEIMCTTLPPDSAEKLQTLVGDRTSDGFSASVRTRNLKRSGKAANAPSRYVRKTATRRSRAVEVQPEDYEEGSWDFRALMVEDAVSLCLRAPSPLESFVEFLSSVTKARESVQQ